MKKNKKYLILGASSLAALTAPVLSVIACSSSSSSDDGWTGGSADGTFDRGGWDLTHLKTWLAAHQADYPDVTLENLEKITPEDLRAFRAGGKTADATTLRVFKQVEAALQKYAFDNNHNVEASTQLNNYINSVTLSANFGIAGSRAGARSSQSVSYFRNDYLKLGRNYDAYIDLYSSRFINGQDRIIKTYNSYSAPIKGHRALDPNFASGDRFSSVNGVATAFSFFRTTIEGQDKANVDKDGNIVWEEKAKRNKTLLPGIQLLIGKDDVVSETLETTDTKKINDETPELTKALNNPENNTLTFSINPGAKYSHIVNGNVEISNHELTGRDFYYGLVRYLYNLAELREEGTAEGQGDIGLPAWSEAELDKLAEQFAGGKAEASKYTEANFYGWDLYNIDLKKTLAANEGETDVKKFHIKFKENAVITENVLTLLNDNSSFQPVPYEVVDQKANGSTEPSIKWGINNYLDESLNDKPGINISEDLYSVAPYLYSSYSLETGVGAAGITLKKNPAFLDQKFVDDKNTIDTYQIIQKSTNVDANAWAISRSDEFLGGSKGVAAPVDHQYILDSDASGNTTQEERVTRAGFKNYSVPNRSKEINASLFWNAFIDPQSALFNSAGRKLLWGESDAAKINNSNDALEEFTYGRGATVRSLAYSAINAYTSTQYFFPGQHKEPYYGVVQEESLDVSGITDYKSALPTWVSTNDELKEIYSKYKDNEEKAFKTPRYNLAARELDKLATEAGATAENPAQIPFYRYQFLEASPADATVLAQNKTLELLNKLTNKVKFVYAPPTTWDVFSGAQRTGVEKNDGVVLLGGFGPDYDGVGSILQQYLCRFGTVGEIELFQAALKNTKAEFKFDKDQTHYSIFSSKTK